MGGGTGRGTTSGRRQAAYPRAGRRAEEGRELSPGQVAAYVAEYSCKASHEQITTRDTDLDRWRERGVPEHLIAMAGAALHLAKRPALGGLAQWVHMLGFRGHFVTKSRGYSTDLGRGEL